MDSVSGIVLVSTNDPFTNLLSLVTGTNSLTIGFYNSSSISGSSNISLTLYNTWQNSTPKWVEFYCNYDHDITLEKVLSFPFVSSVTLYPVKKESEFKFRMNIIRLMIEGFKDAEEVGEVEEKNDQIGYQWLLCHSIQLNFPQNIKNITTGYDVVNSLIRKLDDDSSEHFGTMSIHVPNQLLCPQIKCDILKRNLFDQETVKSFFGPEIKKFNESFVDIFVNYSDFQKQILTLKKNENFLNYVRLENSLFEEIKKGIVSDQRIYDLNKIRDDLSERHVSKEDYYNDKREEIANELFNIEDFITDIHSQIEQDKVVIFNLEKFLSYHNRMREMIGLKTIELPDFENANSVVVSGRSIEEGDRKIESDGKTLCLSCNDFSLYTKDQLKEFLKLINEICYFDPKYINLQNKLIEEISKRI